MDTTSKIPPMTKGDPAIVYNNCKTPGQIAIRMDGMSKEASRVLEFYSQLNINFTVFVGYNSNGKKDPEIDEHIKMAYEQGHQIGTHGFDSINLSGLSTEQRWEQMRLNDEAINKVIGKRPLHFARPYESSNPDSLQDLGSWGYVVAGSNMFTKDLSFIGDPDIWSKVLDQVLPVLAKSDPAVDSFIVLSHGIWEVVEWYRTFIRKAQFKGYTFVTMSECLGLPAYR